MFRITQYMRELASPTPLGPSRNPPGPVVIWNLIRRCNLTCKHCYSISADKDFPGELRTEEVYAVMNDLRAFGADGDDFSLGRADLPDGRSRGRGASRGLRVLSGRNRRSGELRGLFAGDICVRAVRQRGRPVGYEKALDDVGGAFGGADTIGRADAG